MSRRLVKRRLGSFDELADFEATHPIGAFNKGWAREMQALANFLGHLSQSLKNLKTVKSLYENAFRSYRKALAHSPGGKTSSLPADIYGDRNEAQKILDLELHHLGEIAKKFSLAKAGHKR